ncbi:MAG TPA: hypothetical protein VGF60_13475 [Xanthobacteraceae bacterium]
MTTLVVVDAAEGRFASHLQPRGHLDAVGLETGLEVAAADVLRLGSAPEIRASARHAGEEAHGHR